MAIYFPTNIRFDAGQLTELATAIETLDRLIPGHDVRFQPRPCEPDNGSTRANLRTGASALGQSKRALVVQATAEFVTVEQICQQAGLKPKDVRGVLNATDLKFDIDASAGRKRYHFAGKRPRRSASQSDRPA